MPNSITVSHETRGQLKVERKQIRNISRHEFPQLPRSAFSLWTKQHLRLFPAHIFIHLHHSHHRDPPFAKLRPFVSKVQPYSPFWHHHLNYWHEYQEEIGFAFMAYITFSIFNFTRLVQCALIGRNKSLVTAITSPINFFESEVTENDLPRKAQVNRYLIKLHFPIKFGWRIYVAVGIVVDILVTYLYNRQTGFNSQLIIGSGIFMFFLAFEMYFGMKIPALYLLIFWCKCEYFKYKVDKLLLRPNFSLEDRMTKLVKILTEMRKFNKVFRTMIASLILLNMIQSAQLLHILTQLKSSLFAVVYISALTLINLYLFYCIHVLASVQKHFVGAIKKIESDFRDLRSNLTERTIYKLSNIINNCRFQNSFTLVDCEDISADFFRKAVIWLLINVIRLSANQLKMSRQVLMMNKLFPFD